MTFVVEIGTDLCPGLRAIAKEVLLPCSPAVKTAPQKDSHGAWARDGNAAALVGFVLSHGGKRALLGYDGLVTILCFDNETLTVQHQQDAQ